MHMYMHNYAHVYACVYLFVCLQLWIMDLRLNPRNDHIVSSLTVEKHYTSAPLNPWGKCLLNLCNTVHVANWHLPYQPNQVCVFCTSDIKQLYYCIYRALTWNNLLLAHFLQHNMSSVWYELCYNHLSVFHTVHGKQYLRNLQTFQTKKIQQNFKIADDFCK